MENKTTSFVDLKNEQQARAAKAPPYISTAWQPTIFLHMISIGWQKKHGIAAKKEGTRARSKSNN